MIRSNQITIGTVPTFIASVSPTVAHPAGWFSVMNGTATTVYLGGADVTTTNGAQLSVSGTLTGYLFGGETLYGIVSSGSAITSMLQTGS